MNDINILFSVNKKFSEYIEEMIASLIYYANRHINFYLMYVENELDQDDLTRLKLFTENFGDASLFPVIFDTKNLEGMPVTDDEGSFFGMEAYSRLFSPFKLPANIDKVLYLDADMVCNGNIAELYDIDLEDAMWCACQDNGIKEKDLDRLNLPHDTKYINSGMLLINLNKIRKYYEEKDITRLIRENHEKLIYPDQDFINMIFSKEIKIISNKFNLVCKDFAYSELSETPIILHYAGSVKPWDENVSRFEIEYMKPYYKALEIQGERKSSVLAKLREKHEQNGYKIYE